MTTTEPVPSYVLDVNVLIALTNSAHVHHGRAHGWFSRIPSWATTPVTESAFVRLMLNPAVAGRPIPPGEVLSALASLRAWPGHVFIPDDATLADPAIDLSGLVGHRQVTDMHLVNLAARHSSILATLDARISAALVPNDQRHVHVI